MKTLHYNLLIRLLLYCITFQHLLSKADGTNNNDDLNNVDENYHNDLPAKTQRIVGGSKVNSNKKYPFIAYIYTIIPNTNQKMYVCAGSLISSNSILSAAHCAPYANGIVLGVNDATLFHNKNNSWEEGSSRIEEYSIIKKEIHPSYNEVNQDYDFMILQLDRPVDTSIFTPVMLDDGSVKLSVGDSLTVMGWGRMEYDGDTSDYLLETSVDYMSNASCANVYGRLVTDRMLCTYRENHDACQGDSGAPLLSGMVQVGITSWGSGCASPGHPSLFPTPSTAPTSSGLLRFDTMYDGDIDQSGCMFNLLAKNEIKIRNFGLHLNGNELETVQIYHKKGSFEGDEYNEYSWTLSGTNEVRSKGKGRETKLPFNTIVDELVLEASVIYSFYITVKSKSMIYSEGLLQGNKFKETVDLIIYEGVGVQYPFSRIFSPRIWNGSILYTQNSPPSSTPSQKPSVLSSHGATALPTFLVSSEVNNLLLTVKNISCSEIEYKNIVALEYELFSFLAEELTGVGIQEVSLSNSRIHCDSDREIDHVGTHLLGYVVFDIRIQFKDNIGYKNLISGICNAFNEGKQERLIGSLLQNNETGTIFTESSSASIETISSKLDKIDFGRITVEGSNSSSLFKCITEGIAISLILSIILVWR